MIRITMRMILKTMIAIMMKLIIISLLGSTLRGGETEGFAPLPLQAGQAQPESHLLALTG